jgi:hypothetical protein
MDDVMRLLVLLGLAGIALTAAGGAAIWFTDESRRIRRGLKAVLGREPDALLTARGRGRGVGFNIRNNLLAVTWDAGAWCLVYRIDELSGAELIADRDVVGRAHRGETRRALDSFGDAEERVTLRLLFDDPAHADFALDLWQPEDAERRGALSASDALQEANRWLARIEALLRRPLAPRATPVAAPLAPLPAFSMPADDDDEDDDRAVAIT